MVSRFSQAPSIVAARLLMSMVLSPKRLELAVASPGVLRHWALPHWALCRRRVLAEPADEIVGHVMDVVARITVHGGPFLACQHQHRGHAQRRGRPQIA